MDSTAFPGAAASSRKLTANRLGYTAAALWAGTAILLAADIDHPLPRWLHLARIAFGALGLEMTTFWLAFLRIGEFLDTADWHAAYGLPGAARLPPMQWSLGTWTAVRRTGVAVWIGAVVYAAAIACNALDLHQPDAGVGLALLLIAGAQGTAAGTMGVRRHHIRVRREAARAAHHRRGAAHSAAEALLTLQRCGTDVLLAVADSEQLSHIRDIVTDTLAELLVYRTEADGYGRTEAAADPNDDSSARRAGRRPGRPCL